MITLNQLHTYLDEYLMFDKKLDIEKIDPHMTNGLMVKGKEEIKKIGFGVSASLSFFERAKEHFYDALIVHHSFNFPPSNRFDLIYHERISYLIKNNTSLFGYHFLLDAHPEIGNNVEILKKIGARPIEPYPHRGDPWGYLGEFEKEKDFAELRSILEPLLSTRSKIYDYGSQKIKRVVALSGKGAPHASGMQDLIDKEIDLYVTGEVHEWNRELFREAKINFIAGGHYATEVFGVQALMSVISQKFPEVEVGWVDLANEV